MAETQDVVRAIVEILQSECKNPAQSLIDLGVALQKVGTALLVVDTARQAAVMESAGLLVGHRFR